MRGCSRMKVRLLQRRSAAWRGRGCRGVQRGARQCGCSRMKMHPNGRLWGSLCGCCLWQQGWWGWRGGWGGGRVAAVG